MNWISVKDRLPEKDQKCLIYNDGQIDAASYLPERFRDKRSSMSYHVGDWVYNFCTCCDPIFKDPTHWMPLPEPPKDLEIDPLAVLNPGEGISPESFIKEMDTIQKELKLSPDGISFVFDEEKQSWEAQPAKEYIDVLQNIL